MARKVINPCGFHCIKVNNLSVKVGKDVILEDVNLHIHCGTLTAIIGQNGAGKSTLIKAILGEIPSEGEIDFKSTRDGAKLDMKIGYVPQSLSIDRDTPMSVQDMIISYGFHYPVFLPVTKKLRDKVLEILAPLNAGDLIDKTIGTLSGGELQRVLLSLALMDEPNLLLLDEPVSGVDAGGVEQFYKIVDDLKNHHDLAIILVSHDLDYVKKYADKVVLLDKTVLLSDNPGVVFNSEEYKKVFGEKEGRDV